MNKLCTNCRCSASDGDEGDEFTKRYVTAFRNLSKNSKRKNWETAAEAEMGGLSGKAALYLPSIEYLFFTTFVRRR